MGKLKINSKLRLNHL